MRLLFCMVTIVKGASNTVDLTLNDKVSIDAPVYFLFRVIRDVAYSTPSQTFLCTDTTSRLIDRYNRFIIIEGTTVTLEEGQYTLEVYAQNSSTNTDYEAADEKIYTDMLSVIGSSSIINETNEPLIDIEVYDPEIAS